uniref:Uncharacterized protein n=1 Tax=Rhizophagus irregularis (strain DAOM 181602 / DAOM 197198 / MUCL 43194) TaxID=747089 RepID=U9TLN7_RHIID
MFKDQITTIDGEHGIIFVISPQNKFKGRKPNWFCKLNPTAPKITLSYYHRPNNEWTIYWDAGRSHQQRTLWINYWTNDNFQGFTPQSQAPILIPYPGAKMCPYEY